MGIIENEDIEKLESLYNTTRIFPLNFLRCYSSAKREGKIVLMFTKHHSIKGCGGFGYNSTDTGSESVHWMELRVSFRRRPFYLFKKAALHPSYSCQYLFDTRFCGPTSRSGGSNRSLSYNTD